jgi:hypothetical protein
MKNIYLILLIGVISIYSMNAISQELLGDNCHDLTLINSLNGFYEFAANETMPTSQYKIYQMPSQALCKNLKSLNEIGSIVTGFALYPLSSGYFSLAVQSAFAEELAAIGITVASPAIIGISVIGSIGVGTVYFIMKQTLTECKKQDQAQLKNIIIQEVSNIYGLIPASNATFEIKR